MAKTAQTMTPSLSFQGLIDRLLELFSSDEIVVEEVEETLLAYK